MRLPQNRSRPFVWLTGVICVLSSVLAQAADEVLPKPQAIEADVHFWKRVYTEISTSQGFIHDDRHLNIVYETVNLEPDIDRNRRNRRVNEIKKRYRSILLSLARGGDDPLTADERRVMSLWPENTSRDEFRQAASSLRFQLGQSDKFKEGLVRSGRWMPHIQKILKELDVPQELAMLPHVESSFNPNAYSFIGAAGMWQFTRSTGSRYMRVDHVVDERLDPFISTEAAAKLLKHNFVTTGTWPLAITAYNHGAAGMRRATAQTGGTDIVKILRQYKGRTFKFASRNFYVAFLAAVEVNRDAKKYFGELQLDAPESSLTVAVPDYMRANVLANALSVDVRELKMLNPALRPMVWSGEKLIPKGFKLRVPQAVSKQAGTLLAAISAEHRAARQLPDLTYRVRQGDTLSVIADRYHVSLSELMRLNNLRSAHFIRVGQALRLPHAASGPVLARELVDGTYRVQPGDNLSVIAEAFGVTEGLLIKQNDLANPNAIRVDQVLIVAAVEQQPAAEEPAASATPTLAAADTEQAVTEAAEVAAIPPVQATASLEPANGQEVETTVAEDAAGPVEPAAPALSADPSNYAVVGSKRAIVQAGETLGHFAEWLDVRASDLRRINRLRFGQPIAIGKKLKLDFSKVDRETFEARRTAYHRNVQEAYFAQYQIVATEERVIRRGDSVWDLTHLEYKIPLWLFLQYNPDLDINHVAPGKTVLFPKVEQKSDG